MLLNEKFIYFELHKTGCTHTRDILNKLPGLDHKVLGKHSGYEVIPGEFKKDFENIIKIGNIRNPWEWYISLWAFGCREKGMLFNKLTSKTYFFSLNGLKSIIKNSLKIKNPFENISFVNWYKLYSDLADAENFRKWLKVILTDRSIDIGENYKNALISKEIGLLTYRYIKLFTYDGAKVLQYIREFTKLKKHDATSNFIDIILKNEDLHNNLLEVSSQLGINERDLKVILKEFEKNTNASGWPKDIKFYDKETYELVKNKEKLIIQKYGYDYNY